MSATKRRFVEPVLMIGAIAMLIAPSAQAAESAFQQGVKLYNAKNYRAAYTSLEQCLKKSPDDVNALYYEALCCYQLRDVQGAKLRYQRIIEVASNSQAAGMARTALINLDAATAKPAPADPRTAALSTGASPDAKNALINQIRSAAAASQLPADMASLPERASFYFTHESGGHMGVTLSINNHQVPAVFDTGAGAYFYKDQLAAAGVDTNRAVSAGYAQGWAGTPVPVYSMEADVKLGSLTRRIKINFQEGSSGINTNLIGQTLINGYQYEIDDKGGRVELRKTIEKNDRQMDSMYDVPLKVVNTKDIVEMEVNGHKVDTFIDTGAVYSILSPATAEQCGVESTGSQQLIGVGGSLTVGIGTAKIKLGPLYKDFTVRIGGSGLNCIGQDFMEGWRFKIDREHGLLRFFH